MYTIQRYDMPNTPVHTYQWALLRDGEKIGDLNTAESAEAVRDALNELGRWRGWAQLVYLGGGPVTRSDDELRADVCAVHDAEVRSLWSHL